MMLPSIFKTLKYRSTESSRPRYQITEQHLRTIYSSQTILGTLALIIRTSLTRWIIYLEVQQWSKEILTLRTVCVFYMSLKDQTDQLHFLLISLRQYMINIRFSRNTIQKIEFTISSVFYDDFQFIELESFISGIKWQLKSVCIHICEPPFFINVLISSLEFYVFMENQEL